MIIRCHEVLGIDPSASSAEARSSLRKLARKFHPDGMYGQEFYQQEKMKLINLAYEGLRSGASEVVIDDEWWEKISLLERGRVLLLRYDDLMRLTGKRPSGAKKEDLKALDELATSALEFLEEGERDIDVGDLDRFERLIEKVRTAHLEWEQGREERLRKARKEARDEIAAGATLARSLLRSGILAACPSKFDPTSAEKKLADAIPSTDEGLLQQCLLEYREALVKFRAWAEQTRKEMDSMVQETEAAFLAIAEMRSRSIYVDEGMVSKLAERGEAARAASAKGDVSSALNRLKEFNAVYRGIRSTSAWQVEEVRLRERGNKDLADARATLTKVINSSDLGDWSPLLEYLESSFAPQEGLNLLILVRTAGVAQDLKRCLVDFKAIFERAGRSARVLWQMAHDGYPIPEEHLTRVRSIRAQMGKSAAVGHLSDMIVWAERLENIVKANEPGHAHHLEAWDRLRERRAAALVDLEACTTKAGIPKEMAGRIAEVREKLERAFAEQDAQEVERCFCQIDELTSQTRAEHSGLRMLLARAESLISIADERMGDQVCTCCWASPMERRKAQARIALLRRTGLRKDVQLLRLAADEMADFIKQHDAGHDLSTEIRKRAMDAMLAAELILVKMKDFKVETRTASESLVKERLERLLDEVDDVDALSAAIVSLLAAVNIAEREIALLGGGTEEASSECSGHTTERM